MFNAGGTELIIILIIPILWLFISKNIQTKKTILTFLLVIFTIGGIWSYFAGLVNGLGGFVGIFLPIGIVGYYLYDYSTIKKRSTKYNSSIHSKNYTNLAFGVIFSVLGGIFCLKEFFDINIFHYLHFAFPIILIIIGVVILFKGNNVDYEEPTNNYLGTESSDIQNTIKKEEKKVNREKTKSDNNSFSVSKIKEEIHQKKDENDKTKGSVYEPKCFLPKDIQESTTITIDDKKFIDNCYFALNEFDKNKELGFGRNHKKQEYYYRELENLKYAIDSYHMQSESQLLKTELKKLHRDFYQALGGEEFDYENENPF